MWCQRVKAAKTTMAGNGASTVAPHCIHRTGIWTCVGNMADVCSAPHNADRVVKPAPM